MLSPVVSIIISILIILPLVAMAVFIIVITFVIITILFTFLTIITVIMVRELDLLLSVCGTIDPVDWRQHTVRTHNTHLNTPHVYYY